MPGTDLYSEHLQCTHSTPTPSRAAPTPTTPTRAPAPHVCAASLTPHCARPPPPPPPPPLLVGNMASGGAAGATSLAFVYSLDYARTRLANDNKSSKKGGGERQYAGLVDVYRKTMATDGLAGLYRGFNISCVGIVVYRGLYFGMYDSLKPVLLTGTLKDNFLASFMLGWGVTILAGERGGHATVAGTRLFVCCCYCHACPLLLLLCVWGGVAAGHCCCVCGGVLLLLLCVGGGSATAVSVGGSLLLSCVWGGLCHCCVCVGGSLLLP